MIVLRHYSRNKVKHSLKFFGFLCWESIPGPNALTTKPKSPLPDAVVRDLLYTEAMQNLPYVDI